MALEITWRPSPNFSEREEKVRHVVLHGTWMADDSEALARMCDPEAEVSAHYFISREGTLFQMVKEEHTAWHAGKSAWQGIERTLNHHSIGIEISNPGEGMGVPYFEVQYQTLIELLKEIMLRHGLEPSAILGHSDIAPYRKQDPGYHFDWSVLEIAGVAEAPNVEEETAQALREHGYCGDDDALLLEAFKRRTVVKEG